MPRRQWNDGQEIIFQDLSAGSSSLEMELYDRLIYELMNRQQNVVFGNSFFASFINATTIQIGIGNGVYFDNTQIDPEPMTRLLYLETAINEVITGPHATLNRIDLVCMQAARATEQTQMRNYKDPVSGLVSSVSQITETDWASNFQIVAGVASGAPVAPATPAGWIAISQLFVTAVSGIANQAAMTDVRPRFKQPTGWTNYRIVTGNTSADLDDDEIICNPIAPMTLLLPSAALCGGKRFWVKNISLFAVTVQCINADTLEFLASQPLAAKGSAFGIRCDATQFYLE